MLSMRNDKILSAIREPDRGIGSSIAHSAERGAGKSVRRVGWRTGALGREAGEQ